MREVALSAVGHPIPLSVRDILRLARARVNTRLDHVTQFPVALVCAPGGFDKSTVVREFLDSARCAYRLMRVTSGNDDILGILRALATCLGEDAPALASSFATVYERLANAPDAGEQLALWAAGCLGGLSAVVVVDNVAGPFAESVAALLSTLIDRTRANIRWIVVADDCTDFPVARWLAENCLGVPVDAADLAFTQADVLGAVGECVDPLVRREIMILCDLTAGWPAALALALASRPAIDVDVAPREPAELYAYLIEAMLSTVGRRTRDFVEKTCLFTTFDRDLLECAGFGDVADVLTELSDRIGILEMDATGSYQYDWYVRRALCARLWERGDGAFEQVAARSAAAYESDGRYAEAIDIYQTLGDEEALCLLLTAHGFALIDRGESDAVMRAFAAVPQTVLLTFPGALGVKASLESLHGKSDIAEAWFRLALNGITNETQRIEIVYRFAMDLVRRERPDAIEVLEPVVEGIDWELPAAAALLALLAVAYASNQRAADAVATMDRALRLLPMVHSRGVRAKIVYQAGFVALHAHDIDSAKAFAREAYHEALEARSYDVAARAASVSYCIALDFEDDIAAARRYLQQLSDVGGRAGSRELLLYAALCRYDIETHAGNAIEIDALNDRLAALEVYYSVLTTETLLPSQALQATWKGDFYRAYRMLEASAERQITPQRQAYRYAEIAVYAAAAGLCHEASVAAERALAISCETRSTETKPAQTQTYIALAFVLLQRHGRARKVLRDLTCEQLDNPRIALVVRAVRALSERFTAGSGLAELTAVLDELETADLGGIAQMIEAMPLPPRPLRLAQRFSAPSVNAERHVSQAVAEIA